MVFREVRFCEIPMWIQCHTSRSCNIVIECAIEQWFTRSRYHLSTVGVACSLYLVSDCHGLYCEGSFPGFCGCVAAMYNCGAESIRGRAA